MATNPNQHFYVGDVVKSFVGDIGTVKKVTRDYNADGNGGWRDRIEYVEGGWDYSSSFHLVERPAVTAVKPEWVSISEDDLAVLDKYGVEYETRTVTEYRIKGGK